MVETRTLNELNGSRLTPQDMQAFLNWLAFGGSNHETAYESARRRLIIFFAGRKCHEPEALADRTLDIAMRKLAQIPSDAHPPAYLMGIAKNIHRDELRAAQKLKAFHSAQTVHSVTRIQAQAELEGRHSCLEKCLDKLPAEERTMVLGYYSQSKQAKIDKRKELADRHGLSLNALRNRVFRLNQKLAACVTHCLENSPA
ncbi:MAG TPA: hypothetical protein PLD20_08525 [Blastocatellia bacterium]|nr:hypothetical protein [Blastocatellia bacterium]HMV87371.1 hypothetical protein [Blastocatellia bacterium]HMX24925.1 hypothetical protein [Blastocatellia bacterium]HMZ17960.1 hypothetical protein [Blastocatellia bacterium]HNG33659.1 hypothetical protein [Blastocatellia bacterium]